MKRLRVLTGHFSLPVEVRDSVFLEPETASHSRPLELRPPTAPATGRIEYDPASPSVRGALSDSF